MKRNLLAALLISTIAGTSSIQADTVFGLYLHATNWKPDIDGTIDSSGPRIDLQDTLGYSDDSVSQLGVRLEHGVPFLPNLGFESNNLDSASTAVLNETITYDGVVYPVSDTVNSVLNLSHQDILLYYEVLDNWISLDLGLDIISFDGEIALSGTGQSSQTFLDEAVPTLYAMVQFDFPTTGLYVGANLSYIGVDDNNLSKSRLRLGWESDFGLGVEIGMQKFEADWIDFNQSNGNISFDGYYTSLTYHF